MVVGKVKVKVYEFTRHEPNPDFASLKEIRNKAETRDQNPGYQLIYCAIVK